MDNDVLVQIEKYINDNDLENALSLILSNESEYENNADFWNLKGVLCFNVNEIATAVSCFSRAIELDPNSQTAIENLKYIKEQHLDNIEEDLSTMNDENFVIKIVDIMDNITLMVESCLESINKDDLSTCMVILKDIQNSMELCNGEITRLKKIVPSRFMPNLFENILVCLENCFGYCYRNFNKELTLLVEFMLHSLVKELREEIYFFGLIYLHADRMDDYYKNQFASANANEYARESLETGAYKYPVSILVPAYNKLEYTKQCIESILKYTDGIDYELILVNDGSSDGTKEYFESIPYANKKVINLHKNTGAMIAYFIGVRAAQGMVLASVSNDVIVTEKWLENLLVCLESDSRIGMVVPTTNMISNRQAISVQYDTLEKMQDFAKRYNKSDSNKWLERERICPFVHVVPMSIYGKGLCFDRLYQYAEFCDDDHSLLLRLNGYKLILAKDTFCHHFGSVSLGEAQRGNNSFEIGRRIFHQKYGLDGWNDSENKNGALLANFEYKNAKTINVLCIDPGFGMVPYNIRNTYKENGNPNVNLYNFSADKKFTDVSNKIFDNFISAETTAELLELFQGRTFEHIIFCKPFEEYADGDLILKNIKNLLSNNGDIRFLISNPYSASSIVSLLSTSNNFFGNHVYKSFVSQEYIERVLSDAGYTDINRMGIPMDNNQLVVNAVKKMASSINIEINSVHDICYSSDVILFTVKV